MNDRLFGEGSGILRDRPFQLLLSASFVGVLGIAVVSPILERLIDPFGTSAARIGLVITAASAPGIVLIPLSGLLMDRYGRKPTLITGLLLFGGAGSAIAAAPDFRVVLALRLLQGAGLAGINPVIVTSIGDLYTGDEEAAGQGFRMVVTGASLATFPIVAGALVGLAWQYPFLLYGLAIPVAALLFVAFDEPKGERGDPEDADPGERGEYLRGLLGLAARTRIAAILAARPLAVVPPIGLFTYNSLVVVEGLGGSPAGAGLVIAANSSFQAVVSTQVGRVSAAVDDPTGPLLAANLLLGGGTALFAFAPSLPVAAAGAVVVGLGGGVAFPLYRSIITGAAPESFRGGLVSIAEAANRAAVTVTPVAMGAAVALYEPALGFVAAIRWAVAGAGVVGGAASVALVVVARWSARAGTG